MIQRFSAEHLIPGYDHDLSESEMEEFLAKLEDLARTQFSAIESAKRASRDLEMDLQNQIQALRSAAASVS